MATELLVQGAYLLASGLFILALMWMSSPKTARRGVRAGELGMVLAVAGTLLHHDVVDYDLILIAVLIGSAVGVPMAFLMPMTAIPQRTALSHAFGALAVGLIGTAEYYKLAPSQGPGSFVMWALMFEMLLGFLTCTASLIAFGKLQEIMPTRPIMFPGQRVVNIAVFAGALTCAGMLIFVPTSSALFPLFIGLTLLFAGIDNPIYYNENTQMLFGDAKKMTEQLVKELQEL